MVQITDKEFNEMVTYIKRVYGIELKHKKTLIEGRLSNMIAGKGFTNYGDFFKSCLDDKTGDAMDVLINKLTTNHTYFMREADHFEYLKNVVLPKIVANKRDKDLRLWCAASSTGEEPYTLAMIIDEVLGNDRHLWDSSMLASDISERVLTIAREGIYPAESVDTLPERWRKNYFRKLDAGKYQVVDKIRKNVIFTNINLMDPFKFKKPFQVVFCRNVMIYFDAQTKNNLVNKIYNYMEPGGYLFIGHSESINRETTKFNYIMPAVYQK